MCPSRFFSLALSNRQVTLRSGDGAPLRFGYAAGCADGDVPGTGRLEPLKVVNGVMATKSTEVHHSKVNNKFKKLA
jgi:hypothetical protein